MAIGSRQCEHDNIGLSQPESTNSKLTQTESQLESDKPILQQTKTSSPHDTPFIKSVDLCLKTHFGYVYKNVSLTASKGEVLAVRGRNGSGKTALLLTIAGRMKPTSGKLSVGKYELPHHRAKAMRKVGLGIFKGLNELKAGLTVGAITSAELELAGLNSNRENTKKYLHIWDMLDLADSRVKDLTSYDITRLGIILAFTSAPDAIVINDIEDELTLEQSEELMNFLKKSAKEQNTAIVIGVVERSLANMADSRVYLEKEVLNEI